MQAYLRLIHHTITSVNIWPLFDKAAELSTFRLANDCVLGRFCSPMLTVSNDLVGNLYQNHYDVPIFAFIALSLFSCVCVDVGLYKTLWKTAGFHYCDQHRTAFNVVR